MSRLPITKTPKVGKADEFTVRVVGHNPLAPGQVAPAIPQGFVRAKNKNRSGPQPGQTTATYAVPPAQPTNAVNLSAAPQNEAF